MNNEHYYQKSLKLYCEEQKGYVWFKNNLIPDYKGLKPSNEDIHRTLSFLRLLPINYDKEIINFDENNNYNIPNYGLEKNSTYIEKCIEFLAPNIFSSNNLDIIVKCKSKSITFTNNNTNINFADFAKIIQKYTNPDKEIFIKISIDYEDGSLHRMYANFYNNKYYIIDTNYNPKENCHEIFNNCALNDFFEYKGFYGQNEFHINTRCNITNGGMCVAWSQYMCILFYCNPNIDRDALMYFISSIPEKHRIILIERCYSTLFLFLEKFEYFTIYKYFAQTIKNKNKIQIIAAQWEMCYLKLNNMNLSVESIDDLLENCEEKITNAIPKNTGVDGCTKQDLVSIIKDYKKHKKNFTDSFFYEYYDFYKPTTQLELQIKEKLKIIDMLKREKRI